jgi:prepilin peptidase CpaA
MGWPAALAFLFWTAASGGVLALVLLIGRRLSRRRLDRAPPWLRGLMAENGDVPYGIAIAAGAIAAFPASVLVRRGL